MTVAAIQADYPFNAFMETETNLRSRYLALESAHGADFEIDGRQLIMSSARLLELFWVGALLHEAIAELGVSSLLDSDKPPEYFARRVTDMSGLDIHEVVDAAIENLSPLKVPADPNVRLSLTAVLRAIRSILAICPIEHLEQHASAIRIEEWGHRCRIAYDGLQAFVLRADPSRKEQVCLVGREYTAGALSIAEAAKLLDLHPVDALALLESYGFNRSVTEVSLSEEGRNEIYRRLRSRRLDGGRLITPESVARDVVANERIEGIDARRWISREGSA